MTKKSADDLIAKLKDQLKGDESLWRLPLAQAVIEMFEEGKTVTPAALIAHLQEERHKGDVLLRGVQLEAAIERLQKLVMK